MDIGGGVAQRLGCAITADVEYVWRDASGEGAGQPPSHRQGVELKISARQRQRRLNPIVLSPEIYLSPNADGSTDIWHSTIRTRREAAIQRRNGESSRFPKIEIRPYAMRVIGDLLAWNRLRAAVKSNCISWPDHNHRSRDVGAIQLLFWAFWETRSEPIATLQTNRRGCRMAFDGDRVGKMAK